MDVSINNGIQTGQTPIFSHMQITRLKVTFQSNQYMLSFLLHINR